MIITVFYYLLTAAIAYLLIANLVKSRKWQEEVLYVLVFIPFLLRLIRLK